MSVLAKNDSEYANWISELKNRYLNSQVKAAIRVNCEMLQYYWSLGHDIVEMNAEKKWGDKILKSLSDDLKASLPGIKGFSPVNLLYMKNFYLLYKPLSIAPQVVEQLPDFIFQVPWGHHRLLIDKRFDMEKALFFVRKTIENGWSRSLLECFINTDLYERQGKSVNNFTKTLPSITSDLATELIKDPYNFDFARLTDRYNEKELKDALVKNIEIFLMELGNGFAYMGREFRIEVGNSELFADMLFYNTHLHCYVVIEIKTKKFEPSFLGQLSGYVSCANHVLKRDGDNPTVGLLICKDKDDVMAHYALEGYNNPLGISEYELSKLFPKDFKSTLPSIEDIEKELG